MTGPEAADLMWTVGYHVVGFLGVMAVLLLGLGLLRRI